MPKRSADLKTPEIKYNLKIPLCDSQLALLLRKRLPTLISIYVTSHQQRNVVISAHAVQDHEYWFWVSKPSHVSRVPSQARCILMSIVMIPPSEWQSRLWLQYFCAAEQRQIGSATSTFCGGLPLLPVMIPSYSSTLLIDWGRTRKMAFCPYQPWAAFNL